MKKNILKLTSLISLLSIILIPSCKIGENNATDSKNGDFQGKQPKYIFYFVGDGMSQPQITMAEKAISDPDFLKQFNTQTCGIYNIKAGQSLYLRQFTGMGMATTNAENRFITCSAAAATALATGNKTTINTISKNGDRTQNLTSVAEMARDKGMKVGIISSVSIDHATPACFYAHEDDRNNYEAIGKWLLKSNFDFFGGGNVRWDTYKEMSKDQFFDSLKTLNYTVAYTRNDFDALNSKTGKIFATIEKNMEKVCDASTLPYNIDLDEQTSENDKIVLRDFVRKAVEVLDNENGFFLFTEGGKIDWADHANDAVANIYETLALDQAISVAMEFYDKHPDETLIILTGDHECGGLTLGFAGTNYESAFNLMSRQTTSYQEFSVKMDALFEQKPSFNDVMKMVKDNFGLSADDSTALKLSDYELKRFKEAYDYKMNKDKSKLTKEESFLYYGNYNPITVTATHILDNKSGVDWASYAHTALPVPVYSRGCGSDLLVGYFDNTDIPKTIMKVGNL